MKKKIILIGCVALLVGSGAFLCVGLGLAIYENGIGSAETASWAQAFGSIGAILAAVLIMDTQHRREKKRALVQSLERRVNLVLAGAGAAETLSRALTGLQIMFAVNGAKPLQLNFQRKNFAGVQSIFDRIPIWDMGAEEATWVSELSLTCGTIAAMIEGTEITEQIQNFLPVMALKGYINESVELRDKLIKMHKSLGVELGGMR